jgi:gas vesicle protein
MSDSLREALESAFEADANPEIPAVTPEPETASETPTEARARDEQGKFAPKEQEAREAAPTPEPAEPKPERRAPSSWKPAAQEAFLKADRGEPLTPEEVRILTAEAERRESDFHKGVESFKTHAQKARAYEQAIAPYQQTLNQLGVDAPTAISKLLQADHTLRYADPVAKAQYFQSLAQQYGIDLGQVQNVQPQDPQTQYLMQQLNELRQTQQMWQNSIQEQERSKANHELESFATSDKAHFEAVRNDMADLLEAGKAQSLEQAYEMAIWMRPDVRQTLIEQQRIEAQRNYEQQQRTQRAKTASVSVKGSSPSSGGSQPPGGDLRAILESQFAS